MAKVYHLRTVPENQLSFADSRWSAGTVIFLIRWQNTRAAFVIPREVIGVLVAQTSGRFLDGGSL